MADLSQRAWDELRRTLGRVEGEIGHLSQRIKALEAQGHPIDTLEQDLRMKQGQQRSILDDIEALREAMNRRRGY